MAEYLFNPKRNAPTIFDESVAEQKFSRDIIIYSALAGQIVRVAWPSYKGIKIKPSGIKEWLRARGLHWGCFCGMTASPNVYLSSRIIHTAKGNVYVLCHHEVSSCKFFLNLTDLYEIVCYTSEYPSIPKLDQRNGYTDRETADVVNFHLTKLVMSEMAPLLKGFCGDFIGGVEQMAGTTSHIPLRTAKTSIRRNPSSSLAFRSPTIPESSTAPIASTSNIEPTASNPGRPDPETRLQDQREILERLAEGEGIATKEWDEVFEKCYVCDRWMLEAVFKAHSRDCWHMSDSDEESDADKWGCNS